MNDEILKSIRDTLKNDSALLGYIGSSDRIYYHIAPVTPSIPCIAMALSEKPDEEMDSFGKIHLELELSVYDSDYDNLSDILERLDALLFDKRFTTANWAVKYFKRIFASDEKSDFVKDGNPVVKRLTRWNLRAYKKNA